MRTIHTDEITKCIKEMCMQVNVDLSPDVKDALLAGKQKEESPIGKQILEQLEKNLEIAKESQIPICQDTGMTVVFLRIAFSFRLPKAANSSDCSSAKKSPSEITGSGI